jgi:hypothetical protein
MAKRGRPRSANSPTATRGIVRLQLDLEAKAKLDELCEKRGMTQIAVLSRVVKWFGKQDEVLQAKVLGLLSDDLLSTLLDKRR